MNPLNKYFRQPKIYVKLPTGGKFNPELETTVLDEIGVCSMSAIDEITLKNPEALLNGEAIISVIKSCVPSIDDPRKLCNIDVEALFLAIQYATYGTDITHEHTCTKCGEVNSFSIDVNYMLNRFPDIDFIEPIEFEDIKIHIRPPTVENITRMSLIDLEQRRIIQGLTSVDEDDEDLEVAKKFYKSFKKIAEFNVNMLANAISYVETPEDKVSDEDQIAEFLQNISATVVDEINTAVGKLINKPKEATMMQFTCTECGQEDEVQMEMNPANFSKAGS
jgi:hypothetical protein